MAFKTVAVVPIDFLNETEPSLEDRCIAIALVAASQYLGKDLSQENYPRLVNEVYDDFYATAQKSAMMTGIPPVIGASLSKKLGITFERSEALKAFPRDGQGVVNWRPILTDIVNARLGIFIFQYDFSDTNRPDEAHAVLISVPKQPLVDIGEMIVSLFEPKNGRVVEEKCYFKDFRDGFPKSVRDFMSEQKGRPQSYEVIKIKRDLSGTALSLPLKGAQRLPGASLNHKRKEAWV